MISLPPCAPQNWLRPSKNTNDRVARENPPLLTGEATDSSAALDTVEVSHRREMREAWVATVFNINFPSSNQISAAQQKQELMDMLDRIPTAQRFPTRPAGTNTSEGEESCHGQTGAGKTSTRRSARSNRPCGKRSSMFVSGFHRLDCQPRTALRGSGVSTNMRISMLTPSAGWTRDGSTI